jgi:hypothetical protein
MQEWGSNASGDGFRCDSNISLLHGFTSHMAQNGRDSLTSVTFEKD